MELAVNLKYTLLILLVTTPLLGAAIPPTALGGNFTEDQKAEIGAIVREYLLDNPEVLREAFDELEKRANEQQAGQVKPTIAQHAAELFRSPSDFVAGNPNGDVTMVEFFDYNCHYCRKSMADVVQLLASDKGLRLVLKEFPILGPGSIYAARAALASRQQGKYWQFHQALLGVTVPLDQATVLSKAGDVGLDVARLQKDLDAPAITEVIVGNHRVAGALGIQGTPAFVTGENLMPGAVGFDALAAMISAVREAGGCKVC
jgi:protein-disulfide isomerase